MTAPRSQLASILSTIPKRPPGAGTVYVDQRSGLLVAKVPTADGRYRKETVKRGVTPAGNPESDRAYLARAEKRRDTMLTEVAHGATVSANPTISELADRWLADQRDQKRSTLGNYRWVLTCYVLPHVGRKRIRDLTPADVRRLDVTLHDRGLSRATRVHARNRLLNLITLAERDGMIVAFNRAQMPPVLRDRVDVTGRRERRVLTVAEGNLLADAVDDPRWIPVVELLVHYGMRRGEVLGLCWDCVDFDTRLLHVERNLVRVVEPGRVRHELTTPKQPASIRTLPMDDHVTGLLAAWRAQQDGERDAAADLWQQPFGPQVALCFTREDGSFLTPDTLTARLRTYGRRAGLGHVHPHALRHSFISQLSADGVPMADGMRLSGHADSATYNGYTHSLTGGPETAMARRSTARRGSNVVTLRRGA